MTRDHRTATDAVRELNASDPLGGLSVTPTSRAIELRLHGGGRGGGCGTGGCGSCG